MTAVLGSLTAGVAACDTVLGLDAPTLAPCASGCPDSGEAEAEGGGGSVDAMTLDAASEAAPEAGAADGAPDAASSGDASADAPADVASEQGPITGLRCGGGSFPEVGCSGATPVCCETDWSTMQFACVTSEAACGGYPITCADYNDCAGSDVCCHFGSHQVCAALANCPNNELVCSASTPDACPTGWVCDVPWFDGGAQSPYLGCMP